MKCSCHFEEKAMAPHSSTLAWKIPWVEEPGRFTKSWTWLSDFIFTFHFHALEKEMATHSSVLDWRIPGTGEPGGLLSMGSHRVGHDWSDLAAVCIWGGWQCRDFTLNETSNICLITEAPEKNFWTILLRLMFSLRELFNSYKWKASFLC